MLMKLSEERRGKQGRRSDASLFIICFSLFLGYLHVFLVSERIIGIIIYKSSSFFLPFLGKFSVNIIITYQFQPHF